MAKTIEATLRLASDFAKTLADLRALRQEAVATKRELGQTSGASTSQATSSKGGSSASDGKATVAAAKAGEDEITAARTDGIKRRSAAERAADAEALAAKRAALRAQAQLERDERRKLREEADADRRRQRRLEADAEKEKLRATAASARAEKEERRKLTLIAPQVTDVVTGLASGQNAGLVALQQGGQLRDLFGSFGAAGKAVLSTLTATRVVMGGVVGAAALFVTQMVAGHRESEQLRRTLALTGNAGGTSLGQISALARSIADEMKVGVGGVREALAGLLSVSGQTAGTMGATGRAIAAIMKLTGQSAEDAGKQFTDQASGITDWATKANRAYNFLTPAQVAYIRRLEQQGRTQEAIRFTNDQLADSLKQRTAPAIGSLERAWNSVTTALSGFIDKLKELGRDSTPEQRLAKLQAKVVEIQSRLERKGPFAGRRTSTDRAELDSVQQEIQSVLRDQQRKQEAALSAQESQAAIDAQSLAATQAASATKVAAIQRATAVELAAIDRKQEAVEAAYARGLVSDVDRNTRVNELDQQRLQQQIRLQQAQVAAAKAVAGSTADKYAAQQAQAQVTEAEAQLIALRSWLQAAVAEGRRLVDADTLQKSREEAQAWRDTWLRAAQQVRELGRDNALTAAGRVTDPAGRAQAEAVVRTGELQRAIDEQARELREVAIPLAINDESRALLRAQLQALLKEGKDAVDELARRSTQDSLSTQLSEQLEGLRLVEQRLSDEVERGALTTEEAERRKFAARAAALPQLRQLLVLLQAQASTAADRNAINAQLLQLDQLADKSTEVQKAFRSNGASGLATFFTDVETGAERADSAVGKFIANFAKSMLELLNKRLAEQLMSKAIEALQSFASQSATSSSGSSWLSSLVGLFVGTKHTGGLVDGVARAGRAVAPWVFAGAQVLHGGGIAGLAADEVPTILRKGEEVLTEDDPRHVRNGGAAGGSPLIGNLNVSVSFDGGGNNASDAAMARTLAALVKSAVEQKLADEMRPGGALQNVRRG